MTVIYLFITIITGYLLLITVLLSQLTGH